ncbi:MAG: response regulator [Candidatus Lokiarchaeota archaeon]|nr:response regulator [Candidatus Lokiarchaeota archaeon]
MAQLKVMIVEDELITAEAIAILLKKLNYEPVAIVSSGEEAISKLQNLNLDLVLMDIILAGAMDGIETAQIINENYSVPVIFITAYGDKNTLDRAKISEPYGYIVKPITNEDELLPPIELAMYNHQVKNKLKEDHEKFEQIKQLVQPDGLILPPRVIESPEEGTPLERVAKNVDPMLEIEISGTRINLVEWLKSFSNPDRFLILELIKSQPLKLDEIQTFIGKSQSTTSHHIKRLEKTGFIKGWKRGKYIYYSLDKQYMTEFVNLWENWIIRLSS